jgi:hypothetical protein
LAEGPVRYGAVWVIEIDLVENIEKLEAKLESIAFLECEVLEEGKVRVAEPRAAQNATSGLAILPDHRILDTKWSAVLLLNGLRVTRLRSEPTNGIDEGIRVKVLVDHSAAIGMTFGNPGI